MTEPTLIDFPCLFPVKIIGVNSPSFIQEVKQITLRHFLDFKQEQFSSKLSGKSNYLAITVNVFALNQEMLDSFYQDITKIVQVKMVL